MASNNSSFEKDWKPVWILQKELGCTGYTVVDSGKYASGRVKQRVTFEAQDGSELPPRDGMTLISKAGKPYLLVSTKTPYVKRPEIEAVASRHWAPVAVARNTPVVSDEAKDDADDEDEGDIFDDLYGTSNQAYRHHRNGRRELVER